MSDAVKNMCGGLQVGGGLYVQVAYELDMYSLCIITFDIIT